MTISIGFQGFGNSIAQVGNIPSLATIIRQKSAINSFGSSWMTE
ncbi:hypothetical protein [Anabaena sp. UHCC 0253]|nr:hypothetical protein [Anabaena sp. UHCC 0253]